MRPKARRSKPQASRRANRASRGPTDGGSRHGQKCWAPFGPRAVDRRPRRKAGSLKWTVHRGRCGANLQTPRAGRLGYGGLAVIRISTRLDVARRRGPWVRAPCLRTRRKLVCAWTLGVPRALGTFGSGGKGKWECGLPGAVQRIRAMSRVCFARAVCSGPHPEEPAEGGRLERWRQAQSSSPVVKSGHQVRDLMLQDARLRCAPHHEGKGRSGS